MARLSFIALIALLRGCEAFGNRSKYGATGDQVFGAYIVDWAHYRQDPYKWSTSDFAPVSKLDVSLGIAYTHTKNLSISYNRTGRETSRRLYFLVHLFLPACWYKSNAILGSCSLRPLH